MHLVDATGYVGGERFERVEEGITEWFWNTDDTLLVINKSIANGVVDAVEKTLRSCIPQDGLVWSRYNLGVLDPSIEAIREAALKCDVIVIDEAELLDRLPQLGAELVALEATTRFIYVVSVKMTPEQLEIENAKEDALEAIGSERVIASSYSAEDVLIPQDVHVIASGIIPLESIEVPQSLKDRFIHVELVMPHGKTMREIIQDHSPR